MKKTSRIILILMALLCFFCSCTANVEEAIQTQPAWAEVPNIAWEENFVKLNTGITMAYMTSGPEDGPPLLLIHGATNSRIAWSKVVAELSGKYRCYIPELRGHGKTDKPEAKAEGYTVAQYCQDILAFMDAINLKKTAVAGHSLGSLIAQDLMIADPDRIDCAILISSCAKITESPVLNYIYNGDIKDYYGIAAYEEKNEMPDSFIRFWTSFQCDDPDFVNRTYEQAKSLPYHAWKDIFNGLKNFDNTTRLEKITGRVMVIWGTSDTFFTQKDEKFLCQKLSNAQLTYQAIEEASHNIHWDNLESAKNIARLIDGFVSQ